MLKAKYKRTYKLKNFTVGQHKSSDRQNEFTTDDGQLTTNNQPMRNRSLGGFLVRCLITVTLVVLGSWLVYHNWQLRRIRYENYTFTVEEAQKLKHFPKAQYAHGMRALSRGDAQKASEFLQQAVTADPLYMDAWLRLAETEAASGNPEIARKILMFAKDLAPGVYRWQWTQMLLARDLEIDDVFLKNTNFLLGHRKLTQDTLHLLDFHYDSDTAVVVEALHSENLVSYLEWLMRWGRVDDTGTVWQQIVKEGKHDPEIVLQYTHFLIGQKKVLAARKVWDQPNDGTGMTNAGFEKEITRRGFDWREKWDKGENWEIRRVNSGVSDESHALRIWFAGEENISFRHLYQIVPVNPLQSYRLSYRWKSKWITTDQGPFVEIYGYDQEGFRHKGPMITGTNLWHTETLEFTPPEDCNAVVVRLRRMKSRRFDSKIAGTLWLDDFKLEKIAQGSRLNAQDDSQIIADRTTD
jgi:tetratricopeptide (TPR) repeat protein